MAVTAASVQNEQNVLISASGSGSAQYHSCLPADAFSFGGSYVPRMWWEELTVQPQHTDAPTPSAAVHAAGLSHRARTPGRGLSQLAGPR
jgi:hypothetical protein